jgi:hypothetical protein
MVTTGMSAGDTAAELWPGGGDLVDTSGVVCVIGGGRAGDGGVTCTTGGVVLGPVTGAE